MPWLRDRLYTALARVLTKPRRRYELVHPNNATALRAALRPADVVLVDGDQRISQVIKYLTQSSWSHVALYVGDEPWRRFPERRDALLSAYGEDARHLVVEALLEGGVVLAPLGKYVRHNLRVCRPHGLLGEDARRILDLVLSQLGARYDVDNVLELGRYFLPVSLIPARWRRRALEHARHSLTSEVICSTLIARAFHEVGFPILPAVEPGPDTAPPAGWMARLLPRRGFYPAVFHREPPRLVTPRDFDLSPYFEIVKCNGIAAGRFDYRRIRWAS